MKKEFIDFKDIRCNSLKLADKIYNDGFIPDIIYSCLRGGTYLANIVSEYFKVVEKEKRILYAAIVAHSYKDSGEQEEIQIDGWTYEPSLLRKSDKILLIDDIYDSGNTINVLVNILKAYGLKSVNIKVAVYNYKYYKYKEQKEIKPNYYCKKQIINNEEDNTWMHYLTHEILGMSLEDIEKYYEDEEVKAILKKLKKISDEK